jgi:hypothetical protein
VRSEQGCDVWACPLRLDPFVFGPLARVAEFEIYRDDTGYSLFVWMSDNPTNDSMFCFDLMFLSHFQQGNPTMRILNTASAVFLRGNEKHPVLTNS